MREEVVQYRAKVTFQHTTHTTSIIATTNTSKVNNSIRDKPPCIIIQTFTTQRCLLKITRSQR